MAVRVGTPLTDGMERDPPTRSGRGETIAPWLAEAGAQLRYRYDFGDGWSHRVECRARRSPEPGERLPRCLAGARACPPEDCGGLYGYPGFLEAIRDPRHEDHARLLTCAGGDFDPEAFGPEAVRFRDPDRALRKASGERGR